MQSGEAAEKLEFDLKWSANSMFGASIDTVALSFPGKSVYMH